MRYSGLIFFLFTGDGYGNNSASDPYTLGFLNPIVATLPANQNFDILLDVRDYYDQPTKSKSKMNVLFVSITVGFPATLVGYTQEIVLNGECHFSKLQVEGMISTNYTLTFYSSPWMAPLSHTLQLTRCDPGYKEVTENSGTYSCALCPEGEYNINGDGNCRVCPSGATCKGGTILLNKRGYWRGSDLNEPSFYRCASIFKCCPKGMYFSFSLSDI